MNNDEIDKLWTKYNDSANQGDIAEAIKVLEEIVFLHPDLPAIWTLLAENYSELEQWVKSEKAFKNATELNPKSATAYSGMASMYLGRGLLDQAEECLIRSLDCDSTVAETYCLYGVLEGRRSNYFDSELHLRKAIDLKPDFEEPYLNLGLTLMYQNKLEEAEPYIKRAIEIDPKYNRAIEMLEQLNRDLKKIHSKLFLKHCYYGELEKLQELLNQYTLDVNVQDEDGCTGLHLAIGERYREIVKQLLQYNPDFRIKDNKGYSSLHWAIFSGERFFLDLVYEYNQNLQDPDIEGYFPIHLCIVHEEKRSLEWVLEKGADPNVQDRDGFTALHLSAAGNLVDLGQILLAINAKTNIKNKHGETALDTALRNKSIEFVNILRSHNKANAADA